MHQTLENRNEQLRQKLLEIELREERLEKLITRAGNRIGVTGAAFVPIGSIATLIAPAGKSPNGWLACDGSSLCKKTYEKLYKVLGNTYGETSTHFYLPKLATTISNNQFMIYVPHIRYE
jgi:hypothetical protein